MTNSLPDLHTLDTGQCFPLYLYDEQAQEQAEDANGDLFGDNQQQEPGLKRRDAITDEGLAHFQEAYPGEQISKEDLFYYVYGILHSEDYRARFADNLSKELPRIPRVKTAADFWAFSKAGRGLAELHLNFETIEKYPVKLEFKGILSSEDYRVTKMAFGKKRDPETGKNVNDPSVVVYNKKITMRDIPEEAWDYVVNGKPALSWVMERQAVTTHKDSGIVNDANDWAIETMGNPRYPLELFQRVVTVSLETMKIVNGLPKLDI
jgi:predicted helicase